MVYIYGHSLPGELRSKLKLLKENPKNPANYIDFGQVKAIVDAYNADHLPCD
jgi:hypothetical protein